MNNPWIAKRRLWFTKEIEPAKEVKIIEAVARPTMSVKKVKIYLATQAPPPPPPKHLPQEEDLSLMAKQAIAQMMNVGPMTLQAADQYMPPV